MWLYHPKHIFSDYKLIPENGDSASDVADTLTRLLIVIVFVLWLKSYGEIEKIILYGLIGIFVIYIIMTSKKEKFSPLTYKMDTSLESNVFRSSPAVTTPTLPPPIPPKPPILTENFRESGAHPSASGQNAYSVQGGNTENFHESGAHPSAQNKNAYSVQGGNTENFRESGAHPAQHQKSYMSQDGKIENFRESGAHPSVQNQNAYFVQGGNTENFRESGAHPGARIESLLSAGHSVSIPVHVEQHTSIHNLQYQEPTVTRHQQEMSVPRKPLETIDQPHIYGTRQTTNGNRFFTPNMGSNSKMYQAPRIVPRIMDTDFSSVDTNQPVNFNPLVDMGMNDERQRYSQRSRPKTGLLMEKTEEHGITAKSAVAGNNKFYLQDIQPNLYSFNYDPTPINSNIGISYTPQIPPRTRTTIHTEDGKSYPMYTRIDPQLIRDDVPEQRREELPQRGPWSEGYDQFNTQPNPMYDIYDPRFTGYGDEYRSYQDVNMGNVKYYYTDVDAYRSPNFVIRNKVDHVDMKQPMGDTYSSYPREAALEDVRDIVNDDWLAKSTEHREDMMERIMRKSNARNWQMRFAPKSSGARLNTFTSGY